MRNIILTILTVLATIFTFQNMHPVELIFITWSVQTVSALAIIISLILGILIGALLVLPTVLRSKRATKQSKKYASDLENTMKQQPTHIEKSTTDFPKL
ncbi:lipopolysaccharide assembly protein LapA domain-containing protein [Methylotenera sp.]|uniref:lipopolysaccharide assembly protein LapA domain-containing protein n=1 Tax=Methylotenera sp. TaxID=2051956 RepID=UPI002487E038|nr:lipopolysaccharide assembly protein LapA domain-containing protein [Methylotenera sp.]MDI1299541.1 lipopolysaccharide assembly protein LapA domain-containing protein [Methylotenera sp.]